MAPESDWRAPRQEAAPCRRSATHFDFASSAPSGGFTSAVALYWLPATRRPTRSRWCSRAPWRCPGTLAASGNVGYNKPLTQTGSVGVSGALSATSNITFGQDFPVVAPLDIRPSPAR